MKLIIGQKYSVSIYDCCVEGSFTSTLVKAQAYNDVDALVDITDTEYGASVEFENGVKLEMNGGVTLSEED